MSKPVVLVLGSSGLVGKATVKSLSESYADKVTIKAATRDPSRIKDLAELNGVDVVAIDMAGADTKDKVKATGAAAVYIVTPGVPNRDEMVKKAATASRDAGVMNLLVVSSPLVGTEMEDTEHLGRPFSVIESHVKSLGVQYTILRLPFFIDNNWQHVDSIKSNSTVYGAIRPDAAFTQVAVSDIGKASAAILANPWLHSNKTYKLASKSSTNTDLVKAFSQFLGREIKYVQVPYSTVKEAMMGSGLFEVLADGLIKMFELINSGSPIANDPEGVSHFKTITGSNPVTVEQWVEAVADGFR